MPFYMLRFLLAGFVGFDREYTFIYNIKMNSYSKIIFANLHV